MTRVFLFVLAALLPVPALAHVEYVLTDEQFAQVAGNDWTYLLSSLSDSTNLAIIGISLAVVVLLVFIGHSSARLQQLGTSMDKKRDAYDGYIPWMIRLSIGILLIGAGSSGHLLSPAFTAIPIIADLQILTGFLILAGFLLPILPYVVLGFIMLAFSQSLYVIGSLDILALAIVLLMYAQNRPGVDDLFRLPFISHWRPLKEFAPLILRMGTGLAMVYLAVYEKLLHPHASALVVEQYRLHEVIPVDIALWVLGAGLVECIIGLLLIIGCKTRMTSAIALFVLTLSFFYFGEEVYSHVSLFTALSIIFVLGHDRFALDRFIQPRQ